MSDAFPPYRIIGSEMPPFGSLEDLAREIHVQRQRRAMEVADHQERWESDAGDRATLTVTIFSKPLTVALELLVATAGEDAAAFGEALRVTRPARKAA